MQSKRTIAPYSVSHLLVFVFVCHSSDRVWEIFFISHSARYYSFYSIQSWKKLSNFRQKLQKHCMLPKQQTTEWFKIFFKLPYTNISIWAIISDPDFTKIMTFLFFRFVALQRNRIFLVESGNLFVYVQRLRFSVRVLTALKVAVFVLRLNFPHYPFGLWDDGFCSFF